MAGEPTEGGASHPDRDALCLGEKLKIATAMPPLSGARYYHGDVSILLKCIIAMAMWPFR